MISTAWHMQRLQPSAMLSVYIFVMLLYTVVTFSYTSVCLGIFVGSVNLTHSKCRGFLWFGHSQFTHIFQGRLMPLPESLFRWSGRATSATSQGHYSDVMMIVMASQITGVLIVYSTVCSGADQRKYQSSASLAFVKGIHRSQVNSPHKWPVTGKIFPFDDVIMVTSPVWGSPTIVPISMQQP